MIIFEKFGGGQAEKSRALPVFPDHPSGNVTRALPALTKEWTTKGSGSQSGKRLSRSAVAAPSISMRERTVVLLRGPRNAAPASRPPAPFLTETGSQTETAVTHSKQTTGEFLTETRIACRRDLNFAPRRSKFKPVRLRRASPVSQFAVTTSSLYPARPACFGGVSNCATTANPSLALISQARFLIQISGGKSHGNCSRTA